MAPEKLMDLAINDFLLLLPPHRINFKQIVWYIATSRKFQIIPRPLAARQEEEEGKNKLEPFGAHQ